MSPRQVLRRLVALLHPPEGWTGVPIWAPPMVIPAASPIWRDAVIEAEPRPEPAPVAEVARPRLRLVHSALKEA